MRIHKEYEQAFLLEPTKLTRIIGKVHERLADHVNTATQCSFEVYLTGNRREEMSTVEEVLELDNSPKQKITRLVATCSASTVGAARPEHEVRVDFAGPPAVPTAGPSRKKVVSINVRSDAGAWASRALSEVEEQVERTWIRNHLKS